MEKYHKVVSKKIKMAIEKIIKNFIEKLRNLSIFYFIIENYSSTSKPDEIQSEIPPFRENTFS